MTQRMEETVSGVKIEGEWEEIVDDGEDVRAALEDADAPDEDIAAFDEWRPRPDESLDDEVRERTVAKATVPENEVEADGKTPAEEAGDAVADLGDAAKRATDLDVDEASENGRSALARFLRSVETLARKAVRRIETIVYTHFQSRAGPQYLDTGSVSASLRKTGRMTGDERYELSVDMTDGDAGRTVQDALAERR